MKTLLLLTVAAVPAFSQGSVFRALLGQATSAPPPAFINSVCGPAAGGINGGASASVNMTGANFYVLVYAGFSASTATVTDSNSDTFTLVPSGWGSGNPYFAYKQNATGTSSMTFTITNTGNYVSFCVLGFSGMKTSSADEGVISFNSSCCSVSTLQAGSVTPTQSSNLLISAIAVNSTNAAAWTIDSGFSTPVKFDGFSTSGNPLSNAISYKIQTGTAAFNPTWTFATAQGANVFAGSIAFQGN